ncbi:hypothetical protein DES49_0727 [Halospina denitrificans]|uniref:Uncharacterized protein n=1 Tax=Halospina denitrificans TaxID=332522 RepID=A0A4R7K2H6_9GAMM|nr:DUF6776 family protein [Halospina denitrificans]TDT44614.1 hypothetical protein DES49_0727 [Halospina denitrificans]
MTDPRSDSEQLVVVRQRRGERVRRLSILLVFSLICGIGGFWVGGYYYHDRFQTTSEGFESVREERDHLQEKVTEHRQELIGLRRDQEIDQHSLRQAQSTIRELEQKLKERKSEITFYKSIMAPGDIETGLQVFRLDLDPTRDRKRWRYNLVLSQIGDNNRFVSGHVNVELIGYVDGNRKTLSLDQISDSREKSNIEFRFRYFQSVDGDMTIPEDFKPDSIQVTAVADRGNQRSERVFRWQDKTGEEADVSKVQVGP